LLPLVDPRQLPDNPDDDGDGGTASASSTSSGGGDEARAGYTEFEPDAAELLETLVPRAAETAIFAALLEDAASELTARQRAMAAATDNAEELVKKYSRIMNRARQDTITTEIMEIVGGAEALRAGADDDEGGLIIEARV
jgi:F-type H+-transporting ATPase subunit gamma